MALTKDLYRTNIKGTNTSILEPNTKPIWDDLVNELEECLIARDKRGL